MDRSKHCVHVIMGIFGPKTLPFIFLTLMFMSHTKDLDGGNNVVSLSAFLSYSAVAVAFDVKVVVRALGTFRTKGGDKNSFDLAMCFPDSLLAAEALDEVVRTHIEGYRAQITNCSRIIPPTPSDYNPLLYLMFPSNKDEVGNVLNDISSLYHTTKRAFHSTRMGKLLWLPLFLIVWPDLEDYCGDDATSKELIRAALVNENLTQSFAVNTDVYIFLGSNCVGEEDNVWEVYFLNGESVTQKLTPDRRKHEATFEGILGRVRRRRNLQHIAIRAISSRDPSSFLEGPGSGVFDPLEIVNGTPRVVFRELQQALNFTDVVVVGDWISRHSNGTLKGTTVNLFRQEKADLVISPTSLLPYRKTELSFLQPTYSNSVNGFFVQPAASSLRDIVLAPFSFGLWLTLFVTYLILVLSILYFVRQYRKLYTLLYSYVPKADLALRHEVYLWAVGAITQQGWHICPKSNSTRIVFTLGYFLGLVCYGAFSAAVTSILAVEMVPIKTTSDLLNSKLSFYADNASSTMAYIVDYLREHTRIKFGSRVNIKEGVARLRSKEPSCYVAFPHYFYLSAATINISESWICGHLSVVPVTTADTPSSMVISRDSPYAELLNFMILKMLARGLNYRYVQLYNEATTYKCSKQGNESYHPLGVNDVFTACFIIFAGLVVGITLLCLEKTKQLVDSVREKRRRKAKQRADNSGVPASTDFLRSYF